MTDGLLEPRIRSLGGRLVAGFLLFLFLANGFTFMYLVFRGLPEVDTEDPVLVAEELSRLLGDTQGLAATLALQAVAGLLTVIFMAVIIDRRSLASLGFGRAGLPSVVWGTVLGIVLGSLVPLCISAIGARHVRLEGFTGMSAAMGGFLFLGVVAAAFMEEWLFRGYLYVNLRERHSGARTIFLTALGFSAVHITNPGASPLGWFNIILVGIVLGQLRELTGSLEVPFGLHLGWNLALGMIFGVPVSGLTLPSFFRVSLEDLPALLGGGAFGPEASVVLTVLFGGLAVVLARMLMPSGDQDAGTL